MKSNPLFCCVFSLGILLSITANADPVILDVRDVDTPGEDSVLHVGGLTDGVSGFVDRIGQDWIGIPLILEGADYIESAQNNADVSDDRGTTLEIEVDVTEGTVLYMFIHEYQPITPFPWMNISDFGADWEDTGLDVGWTFDASTFDVWRTSSPLTAGTYTFRQMPVDSSFYGIAATPAPTMDAEIEDIYFLRPGFHAYVFYDNIRGADGISVKSENYLRVVNEFGPDGPFVLLAERGDSYSTDDALSTIGSPLVSPDDIETGKRKRLFVADGQAQTVFVLPHTGGIPVPFVTSSTTGSDWFNPFGVAIAPREFDGPNVDPGDLIIADNGFGDPSHHTVWAVNQNSGVVRKIAQGPVFAGGPLRVEFGPDGTLYVFENIGPSGLSRISTLSAEGIVTPFVEHIPSGAAIAVHPKNGDVYFMYGSGVLYRKAANGDAAELFAYNLGWFQSIEFGNSGSSLFVSAGGREQIIEILGNTQAWRGMNTIINGTFETGDLTGWTASGINGGFAAATEEGTCFSWSNTLGLTFNGSFVANVRSSSPAPTNSIGILTSDLFEAGSGISFQALSENTDYLPVPDPVTLEIRVLDAADVVLLSQIVTTNIVTLDGFGPCPGGDFRDGVFSAHFIDTSAYSRDLVRVQFRQHTNYPGYGFFTLIDDIELTP